MKIPFTESASAVEIMTFAESDPNENPWVSGKPEKEKISVEPYRDEWCSIFASQKEKIAQALNGRALVIEHIGSTAVPGLPSKPVIDIDLVVKDPDDEENYIAALTAAEFVLTVRERSWYQHRMLRLAEPRVNLHVFPPDCPEHIRHCLFRDWLREHFGDRQRYASVKIAAKEKASTAQEYNSEKQSIIMEIYQKIFASYEWNFLQN